MHVALRGWRLGHRPELDGLRGVAILLVVAGHVFLDNMGRDSGALAPAGVEVFFALSGFLITGLLLEERATRGRLQLSRFHVRRARRLFPALAVLLVSLAILSRFATDITPTYWPTICYVANWVALSGHPLGVLNATWSLSVEEQFYIAWPLLLLMAARWRRGPEASALSLIMASAVLRCLTDSSHAYFGTDSQMGALLVGALLGISARRGLRAIKVSPWAIGLAPVPLLACGWWRTGWSAALPILVPAWSSAIIWAACCNPGGPLAWAMAALPRPPLLRDLPLALSVALVGADCRAGFDRDCRGSHRAHLRSRRVVVASGRATVSWTRSSSGAAEAAGAGHAVELRAPNVPDAALRPPERSVRTEAASEV